MILKERSVGIHICTPCTLNCRRCSAHVDLYKEKGVRYFISLDSYRRELVKLFQIYDYIGTVSITGGEPLLRTQLTEQVEYTLENHATQFDYVRITTNGTLLPDQRLLEMIQKHPLGNKCEFVIDDYGEVSHQVDELSKILDENHIKYRINCYHGEKQHCNGWVDLGAIDEFRNYTEEQAQNMIHHCHYANWKCMDCLEGKLYLCAVASCGDYFHYFTLGPDEYIDLFDESQSLDKMKEIAASFGKKPIQACQYCNGFDVEKSPRFPAGEQI